MATAGDILAASVAAKADRVAKDAAAAAADQVQTTALAAWTAIVKHFGTIVGAPGPNQVVYSCPADVVIETPAVGLDAPVPDALPVVVPVPNPPPA